MTKKDLENELQKARETISELQKQQAEGVRSSSAFRQIMKEAKEARKDAEQWKQLYLGLGNPPEIKPKKNGRPSKVTPEIREEVLAARSAGASIRSLAERYGLAIATIQRILRAEKKTDY